MQASIKYQVRGDAQVALRRQSTRPKHHLIVAF